jgi:hypothetical protein
MTRQEIADVFAKAGWRLEKLAKYTKAYGPTADENASWHINLENGGSISISDDITAPIADMAPRKLNDFTPTSMGRFAWHIPANAIEPANIEARVRELAQALIESGLR